MKLTERKRYHKIEKDSSRKEQKNGTAEEKKTGDGFGLVAIVLIFWNLMQNTADQQKLRVACVGDELTFGTDVEEREDNCYPVQLPEIHGKGREKIPDRKFRCGRCSGSKKEQKAIYKRRTI